MTGRFLRERISSRAGLYVLLGVAFTLPIFAAADSGNMEKQVDALIAEAMLLDDPSAGLLKLKNAEELVAQAQGRYNSLVLGFMQTNILYTRGRLYLKLYRRQPGNSKARQEALSYLQQAKQKYKLLHQEAAGKVEQLREKYADQSAKNKQLHLLEGYMSRINYSLAWINYDLASVMDNLARQQALLQAAADKFAAFTAGGYRSHPVITDCFLGYGLTLYEQGRYYDVLRLIDIGEITALNTDPVALRKMMLLRMKASTRLPSPLQVVWTAQHYFDSLPTDYRYNSVELRMAVTWVQNLAKLLKSPELAAYRLGLRGQIGKVLRKIYQYGNPWCRHVSKILQEEGLADLPFSLLVQAQDDIAQKKYTQALEKLQAGLRQIESQVDNPFRSELQYYRVIAYWNMEKWADAYRSARAFLAANPEDTRKKVIVRCAVQAGLEAVKMKNGPGTVEFLDFLGGIARLHPELLDAEKARWYRAAVLLESGQYLQARLELQKFGRQSQFYPQALYSLMVADYEQWRQLRQAAEASQAATSDQEVKYLHRIADTAGKYVLLRQKSAAPTKKLDSGVAEIASVALEGLLSLTPPQTDAARSLLDKLDKWSYDTGRWKRKKAALRLHLAAITGDGEQLRQLVDNLLNDSSADEFTVHALVKTADLLETMLRQGDQSTVKYDKSLVGRILIKLYGYLLAEAPRQAVDEITLRRRLAEALYGAKQYQKALAEYNLLKDKVPRKHAADILRGLALVNEKLGDYQAAVDTWRDLSRGMPLQSDGWYEAHYHLISDNYLLGNVDYARKLLAYFQVRYPNIAAPWRAKFQQLEKRLQDKTNSTIPVSGGSGND